MIKHNLKDSLFAKKISYFFIKVNITKENILFVYKIDNDFVFMKNVKTSENVNECRKKWRDIFLQFFIFIVIIAIILGIIIIFINFNKNKNLEDKNNYYSTEEYALLDLGSNSCYPCIKLQKELDILREKYSNKIDIQFFDIINDQLGASYANTYNVQIMPTLLFLDKNGIEKNRIIGFRTAQEIEDIFIELGWIE